MRSIAPQDNTPSRIAPARRVRRRGPITWFKAQPVGIRAAISGSLIVGFFSLAVALISPIERLLVSWRDGTGNRATIKIIRLLPDPRGEDQLDETATIGNFSGTIVILDGWKLRDLNGASWSLDSLGALAPSGQPGDEKTIKRSAQHMGMNNTGDTIELVDRAGNVVHRVMYSQVKEGEEVIPTTVLER